MAAGWRGCLAVVGKGLIRHTTYKINKIYSEDCREGPLKVMKIAKITKFTKTAKFAEICKTMDKINEI